MYSNELNIYINQRNTVLTPTEYILATDIQQNPQINHVKLLSDRRYLIETDDGYSWVVTIKL